MSTASATRAEARSRSRFARLSLEEDGFELAVQPRRESYGGPLQASIALSDLPASAIEKAPLRHSDRVLLADNGSHWCLIQLRMSALGPTADGGGHAMYRG